MTAALKTLPSELAGASLSSSPTSPVAAVDLLLEGALHARADYAWIEPAPGGTGYYTISVERDGQLLSTATIEAGLGAAMIARLALVTGVDLTAPQAQTGSARVRQIGVPPGTPEREIVFTLRPGTELRGELVLVRRGPRLASVPRGTIGDGVLHAGDKVDHYRVVAHLGAGGMGSVYRVEHGALGRTYALKVLHADVLERDSSSIERFLREARAAARIRNPYIVDVFDFGYLTDGRPYFVMELLPGCSISDMLDRETPLPARAVAIASQLCEALAAAHDHGVIHADVTPSNVLLEEEPELRVKLVDFGLAELRDRNAAPAPASDYVLGTPCYISPEQIRGMPADEKSDQYSLGIVLYELLAGRPPFLDNDVRALCMKHLRDPMPELVSPHGPIPDELAKLVERAMSKSPAQRFSNLRAMRAELDQVARLVDRRGWRRWLAP